MAGKRLSDLPRARRPYRLDRDTRRDDGVVKFPTRDAARKEDQIRVRCLKKALGLPEREAERSRELSTQLSTAAKSGTTAATLASAEYHREQRMPVLGNLWKLVEELGVEPVAFVTVRPPDMLYQADDLGAVKLHRFKGNFRNDLSRSDFTAAGGYALFGLDAEFDANRGDGGIYDFHWHGIVAGEKVEALEALRGRRKYQRGRDHPLEQGLAECPRIVVQEGLFNLPDPLTYCLESWIPHRPTKPTEEGKLVRSTRKHRIPNPDHARWLMWMDQFILDDFVLLNGLRVGKSGFTITSGK